MTTGLFIQLTSLENVQLGEIILHEILYSTGADLCHQGLQSYWVLLPPKCHVAQHVFFFSFT